LAWVAAAACATTETADDVWQPDTPTCNAEACFLSCVSDGFPGGTCRGSLCVCTSADAEVDDGTETLPDVGEDDAADDADTAEATDDARDVADDAADDARDVADDAADTADVPLPVACGDGLVAGTEQCDDGNTLAGDGCSPACRFEYCGDGVVGITPEGNDGFETGDFSRHPWNPGTTYPFTVSSLRAYEGTRSAAPGNTGLHSTSSTLSLRRFSDGRICFRYAGESESCCDRFRFNVDSVNRLDVGGSLTTWTEFCLDVTPGEHLFEWTYQKDSSINTGWDAFHIDAVRWSAGGREQCDDGNTTSGDGCSARCTSEICGSGVLDVGEDCDDGNTEAGDGCSSTCEWEFCGDGVVGIVLQAGDGFETGDFSRYPWTPGATRGFTVSSTRAHAGTYSAASGNGGAASTTSTVSLRRYTGSRICFWYAGESESCCDFFRFNVDGVNRLSFGGSRTTWTEFCQDVTPGEHLFEWSYGKDGSVNTGWDAFHFDDVRWSGETTEECDDGGTAAGDGCSPICLFEECGNGYLDPDEQCDDGDIEGGDGCSAVCIREECGNTVLDPGEECDDGGTAAGDGCSAVCIREECGNTILDPGEECDDGNDVDTDGCRNGCLLPFCGDGLVSLFEPFEGFESGDFTAFPWTAASFGVLTAAAARHSGTHGAVSQNTAHGSTGSLQMTTTTGAGRLCFWYTGESESCCDRFRFLVDGVERLNAGGTVAWTEACYDVTAGSHVLRWQYSKDGSVSTGIDRFALDDIRFPVVSETCDDGNTENGDGCSSACQTE
jgi:cysteine-rich repeat protein